MMLPHQRKAYGEPCYVAEDTLSHGYMSGLIVWRGFKLSMKLTANVGLE